MDKEFLCSLSILLEEENDIVFNLDRKQLLLFLKKIERKFAAVNKLEANFDT